MDDDTASVVSASTTASNAPYHPRFLTGNVTVQSGDEINFRFNHDILFSYSPMLASLTDLPLGETPQSDQIIPASNYRSPTVAFLLDCILTAEKRRKEGTYPSTIAVAKTTFDPIDIDGLDILADSVNVQWDEKDEHTAPAPAPASELPAPGSGWPSGRKTRNVAKATVFKLNPRLPSLPDDRPAAQPAPTVLPASPPNPEAEGWGPAVFVPRPWGEDEDKNMDGDSTVDDARDDISELASDVGSLYLSARSEVSSDSEDTVMAASDQPQTPTATFREVLDALHFFDLSALRFVVFDALKASHLNKANPLKAEYIYAFACMYGVGNKSYWATQCLASAWIAAGGPADADGKPGPDEKRGGLAVSRIHFTALDQDAISLLEEKDRAALEEMFRRFSRALVSFSDGLLKKPVGADRLFGRKCKKAGACPEADAFAADFTAFKYRVLNAYLIPAIIGCPQRVRSYEYLGNVLRQHVGCVRCADRLIHTTLALWKKVGRDAWSLNFNAAKKKKRFQPNVHKVWHGAGGTGDANPGNHGSAGGAGAPSNPQGPAPGGLQYQIPAATAPLPPSAAPPAAWGSTMSFGWGAPPVSVLAATPSANSGGP